jgi:hypothetical protein
MDQRIMVKCVPDNSRPRDDRGTTHELPPLANIFKLINDNHYRTAMMSHRAEGSGGRESIIRFAKWMGLLCDWRGTYRYPARFRSKEDNQHLNIIQQLLRTILQ